MSGGRFDFDDGGAFCGGWESGKAHGHGVCTGPQGQGRYAGSWSHGFEVAGVYTWPSGNTYAGHWADGKRHGLGVESKGRWIYRGEWTHGVKGRYGVRMSQSSVARYEGIWSNGLQDGYGIETYTDGGTYQGQWAGGMRHGYGVRNSVPYGLASVVRSPLRTSLSSLRSEQTNGSVVGPVGGGAGGSLRSGDDAGSAVGSRGGFVLTGVHHSDSEQQGGKAGGKRGGGGLFRRGSLLGSLKFRRSDSKASLSSERSKRSSFRSEAGMSAISSAASDGTSLAVSLGEPETELFDSEVEANTTETYTGEWKGDKRSGFGVSQRSDGLRYEGEWLANRRNGYGRTSYPDGRSEEGKYRQGTLTRGKRRSLVPLRASKTRAKVERAVEAAQRGAAVAKQKAEIAISRAAHARVKAEAADMASQTAHEASSIALELAAELSPGFLSQGRKGDEDEDEDEYEMEDDDAPVERPPSTELYRKGTTPPPNQSPAGSLGPTPPPSPRSRSAHANPPAITAAARGAGRGVLKPEPERPGARRAVNADGPGVPNGKQGARGRTTDAVPPKGLAGQSDGGGGGGSRREPRTRYQIEMKPLRRRDGLQHRASERRQKEEVVSGYHGYAICHSPTAQTDIRRQNQVGDNGHHDGKAVPVGGNPGSDKGSNPGPTQQQSNARTAPNPNWKGGGEVDVVETVEVVEFVDEGMSSSSVLVAMVMLLVLGFAVLFVHILT
ncbi:junctophilin-1-like isoform X1 [Lampetra fluviatilis]